MRTQNTHVASDDSAVAAGNFTDTITLRGHFKAETLDAAGNVLSVDDNCNMIMESARTTMGELFANLGTSTFVNEIRFGTMGHVNPSLLNPLVASGGFINTRDRMFSESGSTPVTPVITGTNIPVLNQNDVFYVQATVPSNSGYYRYLPANPVNAQSQQIAAVNYALTDTLLLDTAVWEPLGTTAPYVYKIGFDLPGTVVNTTVGDPVLNLVEDTLNAASTVTVLPNGPAVTFTIVLSVNAANQQYVDYSALTEAALYANGRIFAMKTFKVKVKDNSTAIRITWTISF